MLPSPHIMFMYGFIPGCMNPGGPWGRCPAPGCPPPRLPRCAAGWCAMAGWFMPVWCSWCMEWADEPRDPARERLPMECMEFPPPGPPSRPEDMAAAEGIPALPVGMGRPPETWAWRSAMPPPGVERPPPMAPPAPTLRGPLPGLEPGLMPMPLGPPPEPLELLMGFISQNPSCSFNSTLEMKALFLQKSHTHHCLFPPPALFEPVPEPDSELRRAPMLFELFELLRLELLLLLRLLPSDVNE
mmetsp:Transcript_22602/g.47155  ORF Transcript_22602/g.47155 Transcript_22602/m.47155 type:complete len:243 (+) Transcript_22602:2198-2926(+)